MTTATKTRGRPKSGAVLENMPVRGDLKTDIHHMLRTISTNNQEGVDGSLPVDAVDAHVRTWLDAGYQLFATHYVGETPTGIRILYIFIKPE